MNIRKHIIGIMTCGVLFLAGCDSGNPHQALSKTKELEQKISALEEQLAIAIESHAQKKPKSEDTLARVKNADVLRCGVNSGLPGFSNPNEKGEWEGLDVEFCQAVAAAVLGDKNKVKYIPLTAKERFTALQSGEVDILSRNTTWTLQRDGTLGLNFVGVNYYDGQGFMVKDSARINSANELNGASICVQSGTTTELNLADFFRAKNMKYTPVVYDTYDATVKGFESGRCDALTTDQSGLYASRLKLANPDIAIVLPEIISKEPLGPVVRQGDDNWFNIAKWTLNTMINGEEFDISSDNIDSKLSSTDPNIRRILGLEGPKGKGLGLPDDWSYQILKQVGNYDESFERTVGEDSPLQIARGVNALWSDGGILYAPPIR